MRKTGYAAMLAVVLLILLLELVLFRTGSTEKKTTDSASQQSTVRFNGDLTGGLVSDAAGTDSSASAGTASTDADAQATAGLQIILHGEENSLDNNNNLDTLTKAGFTPVPVSSADGEGDGDAAPDATLTPLDSTVTASAETSQTPDPTPTPTRTPVTGSKLSSGSFSSNSGSDMDLIVSWSAADVSDDTAALIVNVAVRSGKIHCSAMPGSIVLTVAGQTYTLSSPALNYEGNTPTTLALSSNTLTIPTHSASDITVSWNFQSSYDSNSPDFLTASSTIELV